MFNVYIIRHSDVDIFIFYFTLVQTCSRIKPNCSSNTEIWKIFLMIPISPWKLSSEKSVCMPLMSILMSNLLLPVITVLFPALGRKCFQLFAPYKKLISIYSCFYILFSEDKRRFVHEPLLRNTERSIECTFVLFVHFCSNSA